MYYTFRPFLTINCSSNKLLGLCGTRHSLGKADNWSLLASYRMRLLNTTTFELEEFFGSNIPPYSTFSHVHGHAEVTLQDVLNAQGPLKEGWEKILGCCAQARKDGWGYTVRVAQDFSSRPTFVQLTIVRGEILTVH